MNNIYFYLFSSFALQLIKHRCHQHILAFYPTLPFICTCPGEVVLG